MLNVAYVYEAEPFELCDRKDVRFFRLQSDKNISLTLLERNSIEILIARQGIANNLLKSLHNVRWLQLLNAGFENVDLANLKNRNILLTNARSVYCSTIAEDVIAKILILSRNYMRHFADQQRCFWPNDQQLANNNIDISGKTLCILGAGYIGRNIAIRAKAFGMRVEGYDPYITCQEGFDSFCSDIQSALEKADFVVASLPVTNETRDIINHKTISYMKKTAILINVARGEILDEDALCKALNNDDIQGASIDVAKHEPLPANSPLWGARNLLITPHRAAYGDLMRTRMCGLISRNINHYSADEELEDIVHL